MNEKCIIFQIDERKFITKLILNVKLQNKVNYYTISKLEDFINLTLIKDDITETMKGDNEVHPIMINLEENDISLKNNSKTK